MCLTLQLRRRCFPSELAGKSDRVDGGGTGARCGRLPCKRGNPGQRKRKGKLQDRENMHTSLGVFSLKIIWFFLCLLTNEEPTPDYSLRCSAMEQNKAPSRPHFPSIPRCILLWFSRRGAKTRVNCLLSAPWHKGEWWGWGNEVGNTGA